jgi:hypothetical protein
VKRDPAVAHQSNVERLARAEKRLKAWQTKAKKAQTYIKKCKRQIAALKAGQARIGSKRQVNQSKLIAAAAAAGAAIDAALESTE